MHAIALPVREGLSSSVVDGRASGGVPEIGFTIDEAHAPDDLEAGGGASGAERRAGRPWSAPTGQADFWSWWCAGERWRSRREGEQRLPVSDQAGGGPVVLGAVLNKLRKGVQAKAKQHLHAIWMAESRDATEAAFDLFIDAYRESEQSWRELLVDLRHRGLQIGPELAIGDGNLGFWKALRQVYGAAREQHCWVHKTANVSRQ